MKINRKLTLEDIDYTINSWMYIIFATLFLIIYYLTEKNIWIYSIILAFAFYTISLILEMKRLKILDRKRK